MVGGRRDELGKLHDPDPRLGDGEGSAVAGDHLVGRRLHDGELDKLSGDDLRADTPHERLESQPRVVRSACADARVHDHETRDAVGILDREAEADRAAPVLDDERDVLQIELPREARDRLDMAIVGVPLAFGRLVGAAEAEVVRRDAARDARERRDHLAVEKRPRRLAVQQQDRVTFTLVEVMHAQSVLVEVVRLEREARQVREPSVGRPIDAHSLTSLSSLSSTIRSGRSIGSCELTYDSTALSIPTSLPACSDRNQRCSSTWWKSSAAGSFTHIDSGTAATDGSNTSSRQREAATDSETGRFSLRSSASRKRAMSFSIRRAWFSCASSPVRRNRRWRWWPGSTTCGSRCSR